MKQKAQAPAMSEEEINLYLKMNRRARVSTVNKDGTIHTVPVAYKYQNGELFFISGHNTKKNRNIERNSNITFLVDTDNFPEPLKGVLIYGTARITDDDAYQAYHTLYEDVTAVPKEKLNKYIDALTEHYEHKVVRTTINKIVSFDYGKDEVYSKKVEIHLK